MVISKVSSEGLVRLKTSYVYVAMFKASRVHRPIAKNPSYKYRCILLPHVNIACTARYTSRQFYTIT